MADNVAVTPGSGTSIATDDVSSVHFQKIKVDAGGDGVSVPIIAGAQAAAASLPVAHATEDVARVGIITETAPATDTASSGLNGRLQRVAQRITSLIALVPAALSTAGAFKVGLVDLAGTAVDSNSGSKSAGTLRVVLATDQPALTAKLLVTPDSVALPANQSCNVAQINGVTPLMGNGATGTGALRVSIANDSTGIVAITTGSATIGAAYGFATTVSASVTKSSTTTTYTAGDNWSDSTSAPTAGGYTFSNAARISGGSGVITDIFISNSVGPALMLQGELWIYDSAVATNDNDNAPFTNVDADVLLAVAVVPFTLAASAVGSVNSYAHIQNLNAGFTCVGSANLRFKVKVQNAYVNTASEVLNFRLKIMQTN